MSQLLLTTWQKHAGDTFQCLYGHVAPEKNSDAESEVLMYDNNTVGLLEQLLQVAYDAVDDIVRDRVQQKKTLRELLAGLRFRITNTEDVCNLKNGAPNYLSGESSTLILKATLENFVPAPFLREALHVDSSDTVSSTTIDISESIDEWEIPPNPVERTHLAFAANEVVDQRIWLLAIMPDGAPNSFIPVHAQFSKESALFKLHVDSIEYLESKGSAMIQGIQNLFMDPGVPTAQLSIVRQLLQDLRIPATRETLHKIARNDQDGRLPCMSAITVRAIQELFVSSSIMNSLRALDTNMVNLQHTRLEQEEFRFSFNITPPNSFTDLGQLRLSAETHHQHLDANLGSVLRRMQWVCNTLESINDPRLPPYAIQCNKSVVQDTSQTIALLWSIMSGSKVFFAEHSQRLQGLKRNLESDTEHVTQVRQMRRGRWRSTLSLRPDKTRERSIQECFA